MGCFKINTAFADMPAVLINEESRGADGEPAIEGKNLMINKGFNFSGSVTPAWY